MAKKNQYEKKAKHKALLGEVSEAVQNEDTKDTATRTAKDTLTDVGAGVGGGFVGAALGKYSFLTGLGISGLSHAFKKRLGEVGTRIGSLFGVGMMAGGVIKTTDNSVNGPDKKERVAEAKQRMKSYKDSLLENLFLDKLFSAKKQDEKKDASQKTDDTKQTKSTTTPPAASTKAPVTDTKETPEAEEKTVGEVQYFIYPAKKEKAKEVDLSVLDHVENGLHQSAAEYQQNKQETDGLGEEDEMKGTDDELDPTEKNY